MNEIVEQALDFWGMVGAQYQMIAGRENQVYRVDHGSKSYALRLHRQNYRTDTELWSELQWMGALSNVGLHVPAPIFSASGDLLHTVDGVLIDVLTWLPGTPIGTTEAGLNVENRTGLMHSIGCEMAKLHHASDDWERPQVFTRPAWNRAGLIGENPLWGRFWENPTLSIDDQSLFQQVRESADQELSAIEDDLDYGLIHADLVRENILHNGDRLQIIDFDDGGFGFRLFDLATTLMPNLFEGDFSELKTALLEGYRSEREIDTRHLNFITLLRSCTYVGWIVSRMNEEGSTARNERFVTRTRMLAKEYLAQV